jgi:hypothetical protein
MNPHPLHRVFFVIPAGYRALVFAQLLHDPCFASAKQELSAASSTRGSTMAVEGERYRLSPHHSKSTIFSPFVRLEWSNTGYGCRAEPERRSLASPAMIQVFPEKSRIQPDRCQLPKLQPIQPTRIGMCS